ncbi:hypothetical protein P171DRAFT_200863 [Karstenula rhodostoma CBS 690.94]|uniref:Uncharacterized protein n=1 Tax=Karstenula rhodostoma CBS 690.94 TaxID=1392251 RepID=A0A9P4UFC7_9PLEO|nr:hypothetical protein P171DRAFT_200863 [Karstenula rhodostoma CBS 690.94]
MEDHDHELTVPGLGRNSISSKTFSLEAVASTSCGFFPTSPHSHLRSSSPRRLSAPGPRTDSGFAGHGRRKTITSLRFDLNNAPQEDLYSRQPIRVHRRIQSVLLPANSNASTIPPAAAEPNGPFRPRLFARLYPRVSKATRRGARRPSSHAGRLRPGIVAMPPLGACADLGNQPLGCAV